jgi:hypothetical protein
LRRDRSKKDRIILWEEKYIGKRKKAGIIICVKKILRDREQKGCNLGGKEIGKRYSRMQRGWNR